MLVLSVMYPATDGAQFDVGYYMDTHIPLVRRLWSGLGLQELRVLQGHPGPDGAGPAQVMIALLTFASREAFAAAAAQHGGEIFADIANFTDIRPVLQFNAPLG